MLIYQKSREPRNMSCTGCHYQPRFLGMFHITRRAPQMNIFRNLIFIGGKILRYILEFVLEIIWRFCTNYVETLCDF